MASGAIALVSGASLMATCEADTICGILGQNFLWNQRGWIFYTALAAVCHYAGKKRLVNKLRDELNKR